MSDEPYGTETLTVAATCAHCGQPVPLGSEAYRGDSGHIYHRHCVHEALGAALAATNVEPVEALEPEAATTLAEVIGEQPPTGSHGERFVVTTADHALWCTGKLREAEAAIQAVEAQAAQWRERIAAWEKDATAEARRTVEYMVSLLQPWVRQQLDGQRRKSVKLPDGAVAGLRKGRDTVEIVDEAALLAWCAERLPAAIKRSALKTPLLEHVKATGELPPGAEHKPARERFYVDVSKADGGKR